MRYCLRFPPIGCESVGKNRWWWDGVGGDAHGDGGGELKDEAGEGTKQSGVSGARQASAAQTSGARTTGAAQTSGAQALSAVTSGTTGTTEHEKAASGHGESSHDTDCEKFSTGTPPERKVAAETESRMPTDVRDDDFLCGVAAREGRVEQYEDNARAVR